MTSLGTPTRRDFLAGAGAVAMFGGGYVVGARGAKDLAVSGVASESEYLFDPSLVYLDTAALGPTSRRVFDRTIEAWYELETNPRARAYRDDSPIRLAMEAVPGQVAQLLGCRPEEVVFTTSTTEAMNFAAEGLDLQRGDRVLTTDQEHEGGSLCWQHLARRRGIVVDAVEIPLGEFDSVRILERLVAQIRPSTRVLSVSHVLSSTGLRMPIAEISAIARDRDLLVVVDGAQAVGQIDVNLQALGCHAYAAPGHKWLLGPKGTGFLYLSSGLGSAIDPIHLEAGRAVQAPSRGVANSPAVIGLGAAIDAARSRGLNVVEDHILDLRNQLFDGLQSIAGARVVSPPPGAMATGLLSCVLPEEKPSLAFQQAMMDTHRVVIKRVEPRWFNGIRLSPHIFNTPDDIARALEALRAELS